MKKDTVELVQYGWVKELTCKPELIKTTLFVIETEKLYKIQNPHDQNFCGWRRQMEKIYLNTIQEFGRDLYCVSLPGTVTEEQFKQWCREHYTKKFTRTEENFEQQKELWHKRIEQLM